jgi:hypothetical protein
MYDKTIFEAACCGAVPLVCSKDLAGHVYPMFIVNDDDADDLARRLEFLLKFSQNELDAYCTDWKRLVDTGHSLTMLSRRLCEEMS